jgi:hypothetical protein
MYRRVTRTIIPTWGVIRSGRGWNIHDLSVTFFRDDISTIFNLVIEIAPAAYTTSLNHNICVTSSDTMEEVEFHKGHTPFYFINMVADRVISGPNGTSPHHLLLVCFNCTFSTYYFRDTSLAPSLTVLGGPFNIDCLVCLENPDSRQSSETSEEYLTPITLGDIYVVDIVSEERARKQYFHTSMLSKPVEVLRVKRGPALYACGRI